VRDWQTYSRIFLMLLNPPYRFSGNGDRFAGGGSGGRVGPGGEGDRFDDDGRGRFASQGGRGE
jgi:hypothetical protein